MRHNRKNNHLGRKSGHRRALMKNMSIALITHKRIFTTLAKAKVLRRHIEPLVTKAARASRMEKVADATHQRRVVFSMLQNKEAVHELFTTISAQVGERPGGYTRVIRMGFRKGDGAEMAMIEFVDFNDTYNPNATKEASRKKTRRSRRGGKSSSVKSAGETVVVTETETKTVQGIDQELLGLEETEG